MVKKQTIRGPKKKTVTDTGLYADIMPAELERLKRIAESNNSKLDPIIQKFLEYKKTLMGAVPEDKKVSEETIQHLAVSSVMNEFRRLKLKQKPNPKKKETTMIYGFISGDQGIWDKADQVRREVKAYIEKNGLQAAQEAQKVDGENHILDQRMKLYGRENPNYLKPLDPNLHVLERTLFGFFRHNGEKTYKYGSIQTSDNRLARGWGKVKFWKPCQVPAIVREEQSDDIKLGSSSAEDTMSVFKAVKEDVNVKAVIDETLKDQWTEIGEVEKHHEAFKDAWDRRIFVKGIVAWINTDRPTPFGAVMMGLMDPNNEENLVRIQIPEQLYIDWGELSEVYVFGKTRRAMYRNPDYHGGGKEEKEDEDEPKDETKKKKEPPYLPGDVIINATGIFVVMQTPRDATQPDGLQVEETIEGWLE